jgi:hypothetical protein
MPRTTTPAPGHDRSRSLGWLALAWMEHFCRHGPGDVMGQRIKHGDEYSLLVVDCYALGDTPGNAHMRYDSVFFSRPKGCDKSGLAARLALFEAFGPCRFAGWAKGGEVFRDPWGLGFKYVYSAGEPMGKPCTAPFIRCMATEETQVGNVYATIYFNLTDQEHEPPLAKVPFVDAGLEKIILPNGGEIRVSTSSSAAKDGGKETFVVFDEALSLDTPLPTPGGWTTMAEVKVGDLLIGADGQPARVVKTTETFTDRDCYRVTFADGTHIAASAGHLWMTGVVGSAAKPRIRTTEQMVADGRKFKVPNALPWQLPERQLDIDPYVLGVWLGDGDSRNATVSASASDVDELDALIRGAGYTTRRCVTHPGRAELLYISVPGSRRNRFSPVRGLKVRLAAAGLIEDKKIPQEYLRGSVEQRLALVQGLMDSDGSVTPHGHCTFVNSTRAVIDGLVELLRSLGEDPVVRFAPDDRSRVGGCWVLTFTPRNVMPFRFARKRARVRAHQSTRDRWVSIRSIDKIDRMPVKCVAVDSDDHLFVAGLGSKITHNTHLYDTPELRRMYETVTRNLKKRKKAVTGAGTWYIETTTMFAPGSNSVAEATYGEAEALLEERKKRGRWRLFYDHRWGDVVDVTDEAALRQAIRDAYGEAMDWIDEDGLVDEFYDTRKKETDSRRYFLNAQTSTQDAWLTFEQWRGCKRSDRWLKPKDAVCLGLDGSVNDDSTALVAVRMSDLHVTLLAIWEKPEGAAGEDWQVDREAVDAAVARAMKTFKVLGFFCDPAHWQDYVDKWQKEFGAKMKIQASKRRPLEWWTNRPVPMVAALERFWEAVVERRLSYTDPEAARDPEERGLILTLERHVLNARRHMSRSGLQIRKEAPKSPKKIDAAMSAVLAYTAAMDGVADKVQDKPARRYPARRLDRPSRAPR